MLSKKNFIKATENFNTFENNVPAYYFRKEFISDASKTVKITVAVCGFYELYLNGKRITRGFLSPYISNTDHYIYCDEYSVTLSKGKNVIGVLLGNGFQNNPGGHIWDFDKSAFRSAPTFCLTVTEGDKVLLVSDTDFKISPSPIRSDDYRFGEYYDARYEIPGWNEPDFDDDAWKNALPSDAPKGEIRIADVEPIVKECEIAPIEIIKCPDGYIYDFGVSNAGVCRLTVSGEKGQKIVLRYADSFEDGDLNIKQIWFVRENWEHDKDIVHKDTYVCSGKETESYQPFFTYHGFRYVKVSGITEEQATKDLLTYLVYHTELHSRGDFSCSDATVNKLQEMTRRSIVSNFHHFPTDCPQREKNGWTADAALSCEAAILNYDPERNYREWLCNICKAQTPEGMLPGIVPTDTWGYAWGNGPAWDCVLAVLPYYTYIYRGKTEMITECAPAFMKYLRYIRSRCDERGLLAIGLGDWCQVGGNEPKAPLSVTDTITSMDIASKIAVMLSAVNMDKEAEYARGEAEKYRNAVRRELIDFNTLTVLGSCQTSQAMALYYGIFNPDEEEKAFNELLDLVHKADDHIDLGVLGGRVIFHVLSRFGQSDLALKMITREDFPSYGNWIKRGATTLWEEFFSPDTENSQNHHFWGDISAWFIKAIAGINLNPSKTDVNEVLIAPCFPSTLSYASGSHLAPLGEIISKWKRTEVGDITLTVSVPKDMRATAVLPDGFAFENGKTEMPAASGTYRIIKK